MGAGNELFGKLPSGEPVHRISLSGGGLTARVITWGAVIQDLRLEGHRPPLVLGLATLPDYIAYSPYFGATPGRSANRIGGGRCTIDGTACELERNEKGFTHLHGGSDGIGRRNWQVVEQSTGHVVLRIVDPAGRAGYPGNCTITCTYRLAEAGTLSVLYEATTDAPTIANLCQHSYFNLDGGEDALGHDITIAAEHYLPVDGRLVPTGEIRPVAATPFHLRKMTPMRRQKEAGGIVFDHNFCLSPQRRAKTPVAKARSTSAGVSMEVRTTEPGIQFYTGSKIDVPVAGLDGRRYGSFAGFCLETQIWPDAVNHAGFPDSVLRPGETLRQETDYVFTKG